MVGAVAVLGATARPAVAAPPPGPPWPVNYPIDGARPASAAPAESWATAQVESTGGPLGIEVAVRAAVAKPAMGGAYELYYQLRVHTKKGEFGPLLGGPGGGQPGLPILVRAVKCEYDWIEFYERFDVTRKEMSGIANLPAPDAGAADLSVFVRVEPHLYDVAAKKYLTVPKTPAAIVVLGVGSNHKVWSARSLSDWLVLQAEPGRDSAKAVAAVSDLDDYDPTANGMESAVEQVLANPRTLPATKVLYIGMVPAKVLGRASAVSLLHALDRLAKEGEGDVKAAAEKKVAEGR